MELSQNIQVERTELEFLIKMKVKWNGCARKTGYCGNVGADIDVTIGVDYVVKGCKERNLVASFLVALYVVV